MEETTSSDTQSETQNVSDPTTATVTESSETQETTTSNTDLEERFKRMEAALKKANAEAKATRLERDELRTFKERTESDKLTDTEKRDAAQKKLEQQLTELQSQNSNLLTKLQERTINSEVRLQAMQMGMDAKAASKLIDYSEVLTDDEGTPTNIPELLKKLQKEYPTLLGSAPRQQTSGGATNPPRSQTSGRDLTREEAQRIMTAGRDEFHKLSPEDQMRVRKALNPGLFRN